MKAIIKACLLALAFSFAAQAQAQGYPTHTVHVIVSGDPGGGVDTLGRLLAAKMTTSLGQPVVVENRPGVGSMLATDMVVRADPDGYTVLMTTNSFSINAAVRNMRYDPTKVLEPVSLLASTPDILLVNPKLPVKDVRELIAMARAQPGKLTFGSAGTGSGTHMDGELFKSLAKIDLLHVPYKGGGPALTDVVAGRLDMMFINPVAGLGFIQSGAVRALGVTTDQRVALLPDVPTMAEAGVPGYDSGIWYGAFVPEGTPKAVIEILNREFNKALKAPDVRESLAKVGTEPIGTSAEEFRTYFRDDIAHWKKIVAENPKLRLD
jgi:tripartite-type tricarboxylate transporter receptor subunit TctC